MNTARELNIITMLQKESEETYFNAPHGVKAQLRSTSEISAWNDNTVEIPLSPHQYKIKTKNAPSQNYFLKIQSPSPVAPPKPAKLIFPVETFYYNYPQSPLKLPMIRGTKSPIYRYAPLEDKYIDKVEVKCKNDTKKESISKGHNQFTPRSIKSIKNP